MTKTFACDDEGESSLEATTKMKKTPGSAHLVIETFVEKDGNPTENEYAKSSITTLKNTYPVSVQVFNFFYCWAF
jgi:hypothetical protein